jgi:hypothetical protein
MTTDNELLDWAQFVATKFTSNTEGWTYSQDKGDLVHIRYKNDYTGYHHWTKRLGRALTKGIFAREKSGIFGNYPHTLRERWSMAKVYLSKDKNLPDALVNGNITFWGEDGEYITLMGPTVGVKVLEFLRAEPDNQYARNILNEMHRMAQKSWPDETPADEADGEDRG